MWHTGYPVAFHAANGAGPANDATANPTTGFKPLTVDASGYFGPCPGAGVYCGPNAHSFSSPAFVSGGGTLHNGGDATQGICWTTGGNISAPYSGTNTTTWIQTTFAEPWMSVAYFPDPNLSANAGLPHC
jgi:hypothetical protein